MIAARLFLSFRRPAASRDAADGGAWAARGPTSVTCSELRQFPGRVMADPSGRSPVGRVFALISVTALLLSAGPAMASQDVAPASLNPSSAPAPRIRPQAAPGPCVQVEVGAERVGHLDCAAEALQAAARVAQTQARAPLEIPVPGTGSPDASIGVSSVSGARMRLGPALGTSVHRPAQGSVPPAGGGH